MDDFTPRKNWFKRNVIWIVPLLLVIGFIGVSTIRSTGFSDVATAYSDTPLYEDAVQMANSNTEVLQKIGRLEPVDKMAILEGNAKYSSDKDSVELTLRVLGEKGKAKMDVSAHKVNGKWEYDVVQLRTKKPSETIKVID